MEDARTLPPVAALEATRIGRSFDGKPVPDGVDLRLGAGEVVALPGPSGCGKPTLLRIIAGLLAPTAGHLSLGGRMMAEGGGGHLADRWPGTLSGGPQQRVALARPIVAEPAPEAGLGWG